MVDMFYYADRSDFGIVKPVYEYFKSKKSKCKLSNNIYDMEDEDNLLFVGGDRESVLEACIYYKKHINGKIVHIHAGDTTENDHINERTRDAISCYADILCCATRNSFLKANKMFEGKKIYLVGSPLIDNAKNIVNSIYDTYGNFPIKSVFLRAFKITDPFILFVYHSEGFDIDKDIKSFDLSLKVLDKMSKSLKKVSVLAISSKDDYNHVYINEKLKERECDRFRIMENIRQDYYIAAMYYCRCLIGNSSAGMIEGNYLGTPVINVGNRNLMRECGKNVIFCRDSKECSKCVDIIKGFNRKSDYIYGCGNSSSYIYSKTHIK